MGNLWPIRLTPKANVHCYRIFWRRHNSCSRLLDLKLCLLSSGVSLRDKSIETYSLYCAYSEAVIVTVVLLFLLAAITATNSPVNILVTDVSSYVETGEYRFLQ